MGKIGLVIWREYSTKVRNKTFIIMSILGPLLITGFITLAIWIPSAETVEHKVMVIDDSYAIRMHHLKDRDNIKFYYPELNFEQASKTFYETDFTCILHIFDNVESGNKVELYYKKSPGFAIQEYIEQQLENSFYDYRLESNKVDPVIIKSARQDITLLTFKLDENGKSVQSSTMAKIFIGFGAGFMIFISLIIYGTQVMRGVMEEKNNRIVEVIVSSVRPFQLMLGKIMGIAMVGLTQFVIWIVLSMVLTLFTSTFFLGKIMKDVEKYKVQNEIVYKQGSSTNFNEIQKLETKPEGIQAALSMEDISIPEVVICFILYFIGGYLLYASLFAAIGSVVDAEADSQQFMIPVMLPMMLGYFIAINFLQNPESDLAFWGSIIPFTSPIVMMVRLPFGVPLWQIALSITLLIGGFLCTTWLAAKIYRTGILMYGKKITWKELGKWIRYKA